MFFNECIDANIDHSGGDRPVLVSKFCGSFLLRHSNGQEETQENRPQCWRSQYFSSPGQTMFHLFPGVRHEVIWKMLLLIPNSRCVLYFFLLFVIISHRLGKLAAARTEEEVSSLCDEFSIERNEFFFARHPRNFNSILNFYRTGKLHIQGELKDSPSSQC